MGIPTLIGGGLLLLLGVFTALRTRSFVERAARADGVVVSLNAGSAHPEVEFALPSGEKVTFPASGFISYSKGQRATVLYLSEDPSRSPRLDDFGQLWMPHVIQFAFALGAIAVGLRALLKH
jgi:hypothetical protein